MPITLNCPFCSKKIVAKDELGGKWAKCPACGNKVMIPSPKDKDELKLSPVDEKFEAHEEELMKETFKLTERILHETGIYEQPEPHPSTTKISDEELTNRIIKYLKEMAKGDLDGAQKTAEVIYPFRQRAKKILKLISDDNIPKPRLADIPKQVLAGFVKNLHTRLS